MKQNSLIEIGSSADIILRFNSDASINGTQYKKDEPFLFLRNVQVSISYDNIDASSSKGEKKLIASSSISPTTIQVMGAEFTRKMCSLITTYVGVSNYQKTKIKSFTPIDGVIYLTEPLSEDKEFYVYDKNFDKVIATHNAAENKLVSNDFKDDEQYLISYTSDESGTKFNLDKPSFGYLSLEIQGEGNIDKIAKPVYMFFERVSLNSVPDFNFYGSSRIDLPLVFHVIKGKNSMYLGE